MTDTTQPREQAAIDLDKLREAFDAEGPNYRITVDRFKQRPDDYKFEQASHLWKFVQAIAARGGFNSRQAAPEAPTPDGDSFKPVYWFSVLARCARLLDLPADEPIPSGVMRAVEKLVASTGAAPEAPTEHSAVDVNFLLEMVENMVVFAGTAFSYAYCPSSQPFKDARSSMLNVAGALRASIRALDAPATQQAAPEAPVSEQQAILVVNEEGVALGIERRADGKWQFSVTACDGQRPRLTLAATTASASDGTIYEAVSRRADPEGHTEVMAQMDEVLGRATAPSRDADPLPDEWKMRMVKFGETEDVALRAEITEWRALGAALAQQSAAQARAEHNEALRGEVCTMYQMLDDGEWAEHIAVTPEGQCLETAITKLVGKVDAAHAGADTEQTQAARDVLAERRRQMEVEGWTPEHDDQHGECTMSYAAACYVLEGTPVARTPTVSIQRLWEYTGWSWLAWWKPKDRRRNLVRAGALIISEIERIDRAAMSAATKHGEKNG